MLYTFLVFSDNSILSSPKECVVNSVIIIPGLNFPTITPVFFCSASWAKLSVKYVTALLLVPYILSPSICASLLPYPSMLYIAPLCLLFISSIATFEPYIAPFKSTSIIVFISFSVSSHIAFCGWFTPALFIHISIFPNSEIVKFISSCKSFITETLHVLKTILPLDTVFSSSSFALIKFSSLKSLITTLKSYSLKNLAILNPNPLALPVITTVFIFILSFISTLYIAFIFFNHCKTNYHRDNI